jgi:bifunctional ADP-heptose synthase (sugar kinase/adenylyltransferase)
MAEGTSVEQVFAWGKEHGGFFFSAAGLGISTVGGAIFVTKHVQGLNKDLEYERELRKKDLEHEREMRKALEQRTDLVVKNQLFDILHHADYKAAKRLLHRSEASPAARPSRD